MTKKEESHDQDQRAAVDSQHAWMRGRWLVTWSDLEPEAALCDESYVRRLLFCTALVVAAGCRLAKQDEFVLRVAVPGPLEPFSAAVGSSYTTAAQDLVFDTFLMPDEQGALTSRVLRRWERIDGRRAWIQVDPALRFSDGSSVAVEDVLASLEAQKLRATVHGEWLEVESVDAHRMVEPTLLYTILYKQTAVGSLGTAPYRVVSQSDAGIVLERIQPQPRRIRHVEIVAYPTPREVLARVIRGDANAAISLDEQQLELTEGIPKLKPIRNLSHTALTVVFNQRRLDTATRRRLAAVLPIADIARVFAKGCRPEATTGVSPQYQELPRGRRLEVLVPEYAVSIDRAALMVRRALGSRGGEIVHADPFQVVERWNAGEFDVLVQSLAIWPDPAAASLWKTGALNNHSRYSNPRVDAAFDKGDFAAARAELQADAPYVQICRRERIGVVDSRIKNPRMGWWGLLDTLQDWEIEE